jgi:serine/threonine-protein kinase
VPRCPSCSSDYPEGQRFCGNCGTAVDKTSAPTATSFKGEPPPTSDPSLDQARFIPGTILANRYRIVGLLGRGGMGEVYRADDLKLGQPVALKFLPKVVERDEDRLRRFLNEVRVALKVSHPNVCRVHDVGEVGPSTGSGQGQHYLSMEYVDGEDLASLLRRIGRLPEDKAVQIARQLCAGLAAAHDQGILHRDLKPANVMIDGRGRAKITDFGLAGLAEGIEGEEVRAGTPGYMAPEQLAGRGVSTKSDLFSLGLVLYELFTGKRAFEAASATELKQQHEMSAPPSPSSHVDGLDPTVERVILRCLNRDPRNRPSSAPAVAAALPGGDPLAAAVAAGETPSPEAVAGAAGEGALRPAIALTCLAGVVVGIVLLFLSAERTQLGHLARLEKSPEVLASTAREILARAGYDEKPRDSAYELTRETSSFEMLAEEGDGSRQAERLAEGWPLVGFRYRQSPDYLVTLNPLRYLVKYDDPPQTEPGMARVLLGSDGRLWELSVVPPEYDDTAGPYPEPDWTPLFEAAGLDVETLEPTEPRWTPDVSADTRVAWNAALSPPLNLPIHVEAGAFRGKPVYYRLWWPWEKPRTEREESTTLWGAVGRYLTWILQVGPIIAGVLLARHNLRLGRGHRKGALRVAIFVFILYLVDWLLTAHHAPTQYEVNKLVWVLLGIYVYMGLIASIFYLALEPYFRRLWPRQLVSWIRLIEGRLRDPRVGRDLLVGALSGTLLALLYDAYQHAGYWSGLTRAWLEGYLNVINQGYTELLALSGVRYAASDVLFVAQRAVWLAFVFVVVLLVLRILLRRAWLAYLALTIVYLVVGTQSGPPQLRIPIVAVSVALGLFVLMRFGVLGLVATFFVCKVIGTVPLATDFSAWYAGSALPALVAFLGLSIYGFYTSLGGQPLVRTDLLDAN